MTKKQIMSALKYVFNRKSPDIVKVLLSKDDNGEFKPITFYKDGKHICMNYEGDRVYFRKEDFEKVFNIPYVNSYNISQNSKTGQVVVTPIMNVDHLRSALDKGEIDVRTYNNLIDNLI